MHNVYQYDKILVDIKTVIKIFLESDIIFFFFMSNRSKNLIFFGRTSLYKCINKILWSHIFVCPTRFMQTGREWNKTNVVTRRTSRSVPLYILIRYGNWNVITSHMYYRTSSSAFSGAFDIRECHILTE